MRKLRSGLLFCFWIKKIATRKEFTHHMLSKIPVIFEHHQIELVSAFLLVWFISSPFYKLHPPFHIASSFIIILPTIPKPNLNLMHPLFTQVTEVHHEALYDIHCTEFHYFQKGTFPTFFRRDLVCLTTFPCVKTTFVNF